MLDFVIDCSELQCSWQKVTNNSIKIKFFLYTDATFLPGEEEFMAALNKLWKGLLGSSYPDQMPQCLLVPGHCVNPWHLWREVWSWGGPDAITENKVCYCNSACMRYVLKHTVGAATSAPCAAVTPASCGCVQSVPCIAS